jgi:hypothetical protein
LELIYNCEFKISSIHPYYHENYIHYILVHGSRADGAVLKVDHQKPKGEILKNSSEINFTPVVSTTLKSCSKLGTNAVADIAYALEDMGSSTRLLKKQEFLSVIGFGASAREVDFSQFE